MFFESQFGIGIELNSWYNMIPGFLMSWYNLGPDQLDSNIFETRRPFGGCFASHNY